jgi:peroxiredoxin family protein
VVEMTVAEMPLVPGRLAEPYSIPDAEPGTQPEPETGEVSEPGGLAIILYSGELEKTWAAMILASTAGAMGKPTKVFVTFWGLQTFVRPGRRITGQNWMQRMLSVMSRPGIAHRKLSKMQFLGMGPWMMRRLADQYHVASPAELLDTAASLGVEFIPCQMTMDMFGLNADDLIEGMGEPVGAATYLGFLDEGAKPLFI